ncbi:uncharacterized protein CDAR_178791 [Caerostris darwini]|uniref:MATH domain-containing protein n=1 Tax=Caerostris darwini TaxID=1538125 RepID=A0AAV4PDG5_9ARAC|nr:uncharacterized protein CDAR_178791 [Caerostris darwini]
MSLSFFKKKSAVVCKNDDERNSFTFTWMLENIPHLKARIVSPPFYVQAIELKECCVILELEAEDDANFISVQLCRRVREKKRSCTVDYEFAFLAVDGSVLISKKKVNCQFGKSDINKISDFTLREEVFRSRRSAYLPRDTLTLRCRIWKSEGDMPQSEHCFARSFPAIDRTSFVWSLKKFSAIESGHKETTLINSAFRSEPPMEMNLFLTQGRNHDEPIQIEVILTDEKVKFCVLKLSLQDVAGLESEYIQDEIRFECDEKVHRFPVFLSKNRLLNYRDIYLPNDVLSLVCESSYSCELQWDYSFITSDSPKITSPLSHDLNNPMICNMECDDVQGNFFSFIWTIENLSHIAYKPVISMPFYVRSLKRSWYINLDPKHNDNFIAIKLNSLDADGGLNIDYEFAFLADDGSVLTSRIENNCSSNNIGFSNFLARDIVFKQRRDLYLPRDTLTLRFRVWKSQGKMETTEKCFARSRPVTGQSSFVWSLESFNTLKLGEIKSMLINSAFIEKPLLSMNLSLTTDPNHEEQIQIEVRPICEEVIFYNFTLSLLDISGNVANSIQGEIYFDSSKEQSVHRLPSFLKTDKLLEHRDKYLANNVLSLKFEFSYARGDLIHYFKETCCLPDLVPTLQYCSRKSDL